MTRKAKSPRRPPEQPADSGAQEPLKAASPAQELPFAKSHRRELCFWILISLLVCAPFLLVRYVPATDLPQHLCQIRLFLDSGSQQAAQGYARNWFGANALAYLLLGCNWLLFSPVVAGKALMLELALAWVLAIFFSAYRTARPVEGAALAGLLVFNMCFYWGFVNFLIGFPIFIAWQLYSAAAAPRESSRALIIKGIALSLLLFLANSLWLAAGALYLFWEDLRQRRPVRHIMLHGIALLPVCAYSLFWYRDISSSRAASFFDTGAYWILPLSERLDPGLGPAAAIFTIGILLWVLMALLTNRGNLRGAVDRGCLWTGVFFAAIALIAPDKYMNSAYLATRWVPVAAVFFILSLPAPKAPEIFRSGIPLLLAAAVFAITGFYWHEFETKENTGLTEALDAIPDHAGVLGLDYVKKSARIPGRPYLQTFAYAQALHGGTINFTFAYHQNGIVTTSLQPLVSEGLEWSSELVKGEDFHAFDYALINAPASLHATFSSLSILKPVTSQGQWRLYRCDHAFQRKGPLFQFKPN